MQIALLADRPDTLDALAAFMIRAWPDYYGPSGPGDAARDLNTRLNRTSLPVGLVAIVDEVPGGAAALTRERDGTPWLSSLVVDETRRNQGLGSALTAAAEDQARHMGFKRLFCATKTASGILLQRGWRRHGNLQTLSGFAPAYVLVL